MRAVFLLITNVFKVVSSPNVCVMTWYSVILMAVRTWGNLQFRTHILHAYNFGCSHHIFMGLFSQESWIVAESNNTKHARFCLVLSPGVIITQFMRTLNKSSIIFPAVFAVHCRSLRSAALLCLFLMYTCAVCLHHCTIPRLNGLVVQLNTAISELYVTL